MGDQKKNQTKKNKRKIFDSVYRTIAAKMPELFIPLINEVFGTKYRSNQKIEQLRNEFYEKGRKVITDSLFRIGNKLYHFEMQSTEDETMAIRMMEYDFLIAVSEARRRGKAAIIDFPASGIVYLNHNRNRPKKHQMEVRFPNGQSVMYESEIVNIDDYSANEMLAKKLLLFLPYYIVRYRSVLSKIEKDKVRTVTFLNEIRNLQTQLEQASIKTNNAEIYENLSALIIEISDYLLEDQKQLKKEVRRIMGGEILELPSEKMFKKGLRKGRKEKTNDDIQKMAQYFVEQGMAKDFESALELAASILKD